nr:MAG TPA: N acetylmuramidase [Caudoviricetes sp.]
MVKRVYLSPSDQRRNTYAAGGTTEAIQCGRIAAACKAALERSGVEVMVGQYDTMANRVAESNLFKADLHVPIHTNAANGKATGTHLFCYSNTKDAKGNYIIHKNSAGYKACKAVLDVLGPLTPGAPDVIRAYPALYEVKYPAAPTVYIEVDFHDVPSVAQWIIANTTVIGETIAKGLCAALGVEFVPGENTPEPVPVQPAQAETVQAAVRVLRRGMTGADVKTLQAALIAYGYSCGAAGADGDFGSGTEAALRKFQTAYKLGADGIAGKGTWGKLLGA